MKTGQSGGGRGAEGGRKAGEGRRERRTIEPLGATSEPAAPAVRPSHCADHGATVALLRGA